MSLVTRGFPFILNPAEPAPARYPPEEQLKDLFGSMIVKFDAPSWISSRSRKPDERSARTSAWADFDLIISLLVLGRVGVKQRLTTACAAGEWIARFTLRFMPSFVANRRPGRPLLKVRRKAKS